MMKASQQWLLFAQLLEDRAIELRKQVGLSDEPEPGSALKSVGLAAHVMGAVSIALIDASADATRVGQELQKVGQ